MDTLRNKFFQRSIDKASDYLKNHRRLAALVASVSAKVKNVNLGNISRTGFVSRIKIFVRMIKAYGNGTYRTIPWKNIVLIAGAIIYFVTPIDMIPDFIPVSGLLDDFTVIVWVYGTLREEIEQFLIWEQNTLD